MIKTFTTIVICAIYLHSTVFAENIYSSGSLSFETIKAPIERSEIISDDESFDLLTTAQKIFDQKRRIQKQCKPSVIELTDAYEYPNDLYILEDSGVRDYLYTKVKNMKKVNQLLKELKIYFKDKNIFYGINFCESKNSVYISSHGKTKERYSYIYTVKLVNEELTFYDPLPPGMGIDYFLPKAFKGKDMFYEGFGEFGYNHWSIYLIDSKGRKNILEHCSTTPIDPNIPIGEPRDFKLECTQWYK